MDKDREYSGLIYGVTPEEFEQIKNAEEWFLNEISQEPYPKIFKIQYNPKRKAVGIFYKGENEFKLITSGSDDESAKGCFERIKDGLERKLDLVRLPLEEWRD